MSIDDYLHQLHSINMLITCSPKAELVSENLVNLLKQFKIVKPLQASIREPGSNQLFPVTEVRIKLQELDDFENKPNSAQIKKILYDCVLQYNNSRSLEELSGSIFDNAPWFYTWKKTFFANLELCDLEFIGANIGTIYILTENDLENYEDIISKLHIKVKSVPNIKWFWSNYLKYYVIVSDHNRTSEDTDQFVPNKHRNMLFNKFISLYDANKCYWFELDKTSVYENANEEISLDEETSRNISDHNDPLSLMSEISEDEQFSNPKEKKVKLFLTTDELIRKCDKLLRELVVKAIIPWSERQLRLLNDSLSSRKGIRSFVTATKHFFSPSMISQKVPSQVIVYSLEANEMQQRKFADLVMCFNLYELAYSHYYSAKKEFKNEAAWSYYASSCESAALASYMMGKFQRHYFEQAISYYIESAKLYNLATRATILATDIIKDGLPCEASNLFVRLTSDNGDVRSALFLEQAARCFQTAIPSKYRKAGLYYVLAGFRYDMCGLKKLALCCYTKCCIGPKWSSAADFVLNKKGTLYLQIANTGLGINEDYLNQGCEILRKNSDRKIFFQELIRELTKKEKFDLVQDVKVPFIKAVVLNDEIEAKFLVSNNRKQPCFSGERMHLTLCMVSKFQINMKKAKLWCSHEMECEEIEIALLAEEEKYVKMSLIPVPGDFTVMGIIYECLGIICRVEFDDKLKEACKFSAIKGLPLANVNIKLEKYENHEKIELLTGQLINITVSVELSGNFDANLISNARLVKMDFTVQDISSQLPDKLDDDEVVYPIKLNTDNIFVLQAPFLPQSRTFLFKIVYSNDGQSRMILKYINVIVKACLEIENNVCGIVGLKNVTNGIIQISSGDEKLVMNRGCTGYIWAGKVEWQTEKCRGWIITG